MDLVRRTDELVDLLGNWSAGTGALYRRLAASLRGLVEQGSLVPGERLPSERNLAAALRISRTTVVSAYDHLRDEDVLESRQGSGTRVCSTRAPVRADGWAAAGNGNPMYSNLLRADENVIPVSCLRTPALAGVEQAIREVVAEDLPALMAEGTYYPRGLPALREAISRHHERQGLPTHPDQIVVTTGAHQAVALVAQLYLRKGSPVVSEDPSFAGCLDLMRDRGAQIHPVPMDAQGIDANGVRRAFAGYAPHLLYVMPSYHNPTGTLMSAARRRELGELSARHGVPILEDSAYTGIRAADEPAPLAAYAPRGAEVISVDSLSKVGWAGLRVGWLRAPAEMALRLSRRKVLADLASPLLDQAVAVRLLDRYGQLAHQRSEELREALAHMGSLLRRDLPDWRWEAPDGGAALWVHLPGVNARTFAQVALCHDVELVPGPVMSASEGGLHDEYFRLPFAYDRETREELVWRLARAWRELDRYGPVESHPDALVV
ncbi:GntR family transcriptional regulator [Nocardiopsis terrae]|uniref:DNA-binding transcriptional MocR family regulator n=1 Tax=Nocardiopsis terrae TaxID=372655 RepID=A0ABR9HKC9_9ACTN|nr:PLP-dependent aminotransferase family protein [Nocardiopsis terrae]MBE1459443.1 DNA-binding transcriptional MocR family regulator [Nocardiopsis terrae]GHC95589.1 GntR family transcriptional regulator [Nocardiopsis terrae]